ncbi:MAG: hypothetical protein E7B61_04725 [Clostridiales bacterium]|nr:hypothetical protein [Clostridiales bacterium]
MTDEERIISCQQEIRRLRGVVQEYEEKRREFLEWLEEESKIPTGIFHPRTPGILVITVIEKIITVITRLKMGCFKFPNSANYGIK